MHKAFWEGKRRIAVITSEERVMCVGGGSQHFVVVLLYCWNLFFTVGHVLS